MDPIRYQNQFGFTKGKQTRANQTRTGISELLKRRGQEYFTLVLTKNDSNLVAALSYCSDEGN